VNCYPAALRGNKEVSVIGVIIILLVGAIGFAAWAFASRVIQNDEAAYNARHRTRTTK
jgi:hypothetical protein